MRLSFFHDETISITVGISLLLHGSVFVVSSLHLFRKKYSLNEYRIVELVDQEPKGHAGKGGGRPHASRDIIIPKPSAQPSIRESVPQKLVPDTTEETGEESDGDDEGGDGTGGGSGDGESGSYLPVFKVARLPEFVARVKPVYPPQAKLKGKEAEVLVEVYIDTEGKPRKVVLLRSGGSDFDAATLEAAYRSTFRPAIAKDGKPVPVRVQIPYTFELE